MFAGKPFVSDRTISYVGIVASAVLAFVCLHVAAFISDFIRGFVITYRPDLALPAVTAFIFAHVHTIRYAGYAIPLVILGVGVACVRRAPNSNQAMRGALQLSTLSSAFSSITLVAVVGCIARAFIVTLMAQWPVSQ